MCASCISATAMRSHDHIVLGDPVISVEESEWGIRRYVKYPDGKDLTFFFGMPNINFINGQVVDAVIKRADVMVFKVPVDDENHIHFEVRAIRLTGERGRAWIEERRAMRAQAEKDRPELVRAILAGKLRSTMSIPIASTSSCSKMKSRRPAKARSPCAATNTSAAATAAYFCCAKSGSENCAISQRAGRSNSGRIGRIWCRPIRKVYAIASLVRRAAVSIRSNRCRRCQIVTFAPVRILRFAS